MSPKHGKSNGICVATQKCNNAIGRWKCKSCLKGSYWLKGYIKFWGLKQKEGTK